MACTLCECWQYFQMFWSDFKKRYQTVKTFDSIMPPRSWHFWSGNCMQIGTYLIYKNSLVLHIKIQKSFKHK